MCVDWLQTLTQTHIHTIMIPFNEDLIELAADSHHGQYMMQYALERINFNVPDNLKEDYELVLSGDTENEWYWESVNVILDNLTLDVSDGDGTITYGLCFNEDLWLVPLDMDIEDWII